MLDKIRRWIQLSGEEKSFFLEAYFTLGLMRAKMLLFSFKYVTRSLHHSPKQRNRVEIDDKQQQMALDVGKAVERVAVYTPWKSVCLVQALSAQKMLHKRGIPGMFYLGVAKDKGSKTGITAHAWTECGEHIITGGEGHASFTVVSVFEWEGK